MGPKQNCFGRIEFPNTAKMIALSSASYTFENLYKIANIIKGNTEGAYVMQNNNTQA